MPASTARMPRLAVAVGVATLFVTGCGAFDTMSHRIAGGVTPYRVEIVQGNFVSREQVALLKPGMTRQQVRDLLGTPLVTSLFHAERWDYVFTLQRDGVAPQRRKLTVYFRGDTLERHEGDAMPSEAEFVATLSGRRALGKVPPLTATEAQLAAFPRQAASAPQPAADAAPPTTNYPPLEAPAR